MNDFVEILLKPISEIWKLLETQSKAQASICMISRYMIDHLKHTNSLMEPYSKDELLAKDGLLEHIFLTHKLSYEAFDLLYNNKEVLIYPFLINAWAVIETAFDDLIIRLLINDTKATEKLLAFGINDSKKHTVGSESWAKDMFHKIKRKASENTKNSVFEYHKACFSYFEINLEYQTARVVALNEINQIRNLYTAQSRHSKAIRCKYMSQTNTLHW